ncbi:type I secretion system permease/ATPase [Parvularcula oceani]|uniref:type I secretion system permease/ATPase n=1 Tax=Parvularcula oceani TaxID=1247963 RepID=UPI00069065B7|nr:type I secretion system permease/ATPase [Parvularcula oceani]
MTQNQVQIADAPQDRLAASASLAGVETEPGDARLSRRAARRLRNHLWAAAGFSVVVNLLFLVSPLYMLQVYDRVLASRSIETLILLSLIAVFLLLLYIAAEGGRKRVLARAGQILGESLDGMTLRRGLAAAGTPSARTVAAVGNLSRVQGLLLQGTLSPLFDIPFVPLFILVLFVIHPVLGLISLAGAGVLLALAVLTDRLSRKSVEEAGKQDQRAQSHLGHLVRQRAAIVSMGMTDRAVGRWQQLRREAVDTNIAAGEGATYLSSTTRSFRQILQIAILGSGAALAVAGAITPGSIIAGSIIMGRGLAPIDQTVSIWRQVILGRKAWRELSEWVDTHDASDLPMEVAAVTALPRPDPVLKLEEFAVGIPGSKKPLLPQMTVELPRGGLIALLGPSGAGKTSFLQSVAGAWAPQHGTVRLGGRDLASWDARDRGRFVGYLPQHVELLTGTVFENICRFTDADPERVFEAARRVGCHDMILTLPKAYDTPIGEGGVHLSAGQRQSIGLARAFFGHPALLLLDEPTAHLDANLAAALMGRFAAYARQPQSERDVTAIIATHDLRLINAADQVMLIQDRKIVLSPREDYLKRVSDLRRSRRGQPAQARPKVETGGDAPEGTGGSGTAPVTVAMPLPDGSAS